MVPILTALVWRYNARARHEQEYSLRILWYAVSFIDSEAGVVRRLFVTDRAGIVDLHDEVVDVAAAADVEPDI